MHTFILWARFFDCLKPYKFSHYKEAVKEDFFNMETIGEGRMWETSLSEYILNSEARMKHLSK
jgi:hypothetical protein